MRRRTPLVLALAAALVVGVAVAVNATAGDGGGGGTLAELTRREYPPGERPPAPTIAGETLEGDSLDLADLRGDVVVVNVWGSWCGPCRSEMPELEQVHQNTREQGVRFVGVNIRDDLDRARSFAARRITYPSIFDPGSQYTLGFTDTPPPPGVPATLVIDRDGNLAATIYRVVDAPELERVVTAVASEEAGGG